jgi:exosortase/archaeosortase family protein
VPAQPPDLETHGFRGWRGLLPLGLVALLAQLSQAKDLFGGVMRPIVLTLVNAAGISASDHGDNLSIGNLEVPWSRDCAGLNLLIILLAVAIWVNRNESPGFAYWVRIAAMIPAAVFANVARIFTIIAYRHFFYPEIESPQLHYFIGLLWLVPFAMLVMPKDSRPWMAHVFELLHTASVVALLSPMVDGPGGIGLSIAVVFGLAHCRFPASVSILRLAAFAAWLIAAAAITWAGVESFWMPWLLVCPLLADPAWVLRPAGALLILASHPMFALIRGGEAVTWLGICLAAWKQFSPEPPPRVSNGKESPHATVVVCMAAGILVFVLPFLSSSFFGTGIEKLLPPDGVQKKEIPGSGFQLRLPGQSDDIGLFWYMPSGKQRHHTLRICMKYRGIDLRPSGKDGDVMTDGNLWMREFFFEDGKLLDSHIAYVISTLGPGKSAGVHLIFVGTKASMSASEFDTATRDLAARLVFPNPAVRTGAR